jgi:transposase-like protein
MSVDPFETPPKPPRKRRYFTREFKQATVDEILETGQSISSVSLRLGINDNIVRRWVDEFGNRPPQPRFVPVICDATDGSMVPECASTVTPPATRQPSVTDAPTNRRHVSQGLVGSLRLQTPVATLELQGTFDHSMLEMLLSRVLP